MQQDQRIAKFLSEQRDQAPADKQPLFYRFDELWERKLWHELTDNLLEYFSDESSLSQRLPIFQHFILTFADEINQLRFARLGLIASIQCGDDRERLTFLTSLADKVNKPDSQVAYVYASSEVSRVKLQLGRLDDARELLDELAAQLSCFDYVENIVHAAFYAANADYYHMKMESTMFYRNTLLYLACVDITTLSQEGRLKHAFDLSVATMVSDSIYTFGELLNHPILESLEGTQYTWLRDLLFAFNQGDLVAFDALSVNFSKISLLENHKVFLYQKMALFALISMVFRRSPHNRTLSFATIFEETGIQLYEIELLIMKAFGLGLLKGSIDHINQTTTINWIQPKVLGTPQIQDVRWQLKEWNDGVSSLGNWIENAGREVSVA